MTNTAFLLVIFSRRKTVSKDGIVFPEIDEFIAKCKAVFKDKKNTELDNLERNITFFRQNYARHIQLKKEKNEKLKDPNLPKYAKFNIGGESFAIATNRLYPNSLFEKIVCTGILPPDERGEYFINATPFFAQVIFDWMRDPTSNYPETPFGDICFAFVLRRYINLYHLDVDVRRTGTLQ